MARKKFYAVKKGITPGIYKTWDECKKNTDGYPGAQYKRFSTEEEALQFLDEVTGNLDEITKVETNESISEELTLLDDSTLVAFVDGSYSKESNLYGYGIVFINHSGDIDTMYGSDDNDVYIDSKNVAGEVEGVKSAITHALVQSYKKIIIYYDYEGIEKWANGSWETNKPVSQDYVEFIKGMDYNLEIEFRKVHAHTGITFNEQADRLAKKSLVQKGIKTKSEGTLSVSGIEEEEFEGVFEILKDLNEDIKVNRKPEIENRHVYILTLKKEKIVITLFDSGNTLIQGKQSTLLELFTTLIVELLPNETEVIELLNTYNHYSVSIPKFDLDVAFVELLPDFDQSKTENQTLINTLKQAVYNTLIDGERPDYTDLITPVFRALEYYIYEILITKGIVNKFDGKHGFGCFEYTDNTKTIYCIQKGHQSKFINEPEHLTYVNKLYNLYYNYRNVYSHWDKTGMTETIDTIEIARDRIKDHLNDFNEYYKIF